MEGWTKTGKYRYSKENLRVFGNKRNKKRKKPKWYWAVKHLENTLGMEYDLFGSAPSRDVAMEKAEYCQVMTELNKGD